MYRIRTLLVAAMVLSQFVTVGWLAPSKASLAEKTRTLSQSEYFDRVHACWLGQIIACMMGLDFEGRPASVEWVDKFNRDWPHAPVDDDWYYEMENLKAFEKFGPALTVQQVGEIWLEDKVGFAGSSAEARKALQLGVKGGDSGHPRYNRLWFTMGNQCRGDLPGMLAPGLPNVAARISRETGHVNSYGEGTEGGVLLSTMVSMAFFDKDPRKILREALEILHPDSPQRLCVSEVIFRAERGETPKEISQALIRRWRPDYPVFNGAVLNMGFSALGLWFGEGDYLKTVNVVFAAGDNSDADCNAAVAGSVIATMLGTKGLPANLIAGVRNRIAGAKYNAHPLSSPVDETVTHLSERTVAMGLKVLAAEGVSVKDGQLQLPAQRIAPQPLERFAPGDYVRYWNPGWTLERAGFVSHHGGTYLESDEVLATFPKDESMPVLLTRTVTLDADPVLKFEVSADANREWKLEVWANNQRLNQTTVKGAAERHWEAISLDLAAFAGKKVVLRLYQEVRTPSPGTAYWRSLRIE